VCRRLTRSTGKTYFLYYVLIERLLQGETTLFQSKKGDLVVIEDNKPVWRVGGNDDLSRLPGDDVWALVDGDPTGSQPHMELQVDWLTNVRIVMASSPKIQSHQNWLKQVLGKLYYMKTWARDDMFVAGCVVRSLA
jgi:hypothetical protein